MNRKRAAGAAAICLTLLAGLSWGVAMGSERPAVNALGTDTATFATANVGRHSTTPETGAAMERVRTISGGRAIVGWQEIDEANSPVNEHALLQRIYPAPSAYHHIAFQYRVPVTRPRGTWAVDRVRVLPGSPGIPRISPERKIIVAEMRHAGSGRSQVVVNTHFVAGAWNGRPMKYKACGRSIGTSTTPTCTTSLWSTSPRDATWW